MYTVVKRTEQDLSTEKINLIFDYFLNIKKNRLLAVILGAQVEEGLLPISSWPFLHGRHR